MKEVLHQYSTKPHIYKLTDLRNGKIYIGKHYPNLKRVVKKYFTGGKIPKRIIKKYGKELFKREIIKKGNFTNEQLSDLEIFYIAVFRSFDKRYGYNLTKGGEGSFGIKQSKETIEKRVSKISGKNNWMYGLRGEDNPNFGSKRSEETKKKMSLAQKGKVVSEEQKQKLREINLGKKHSEESKAKMGKSGKNHNFYGKKHSEESKLKNSLAHLGEKNPNFGKKWTDERRKKLSNSKTGVPLSKKHRESLSNAQKNIKKIKCNHCDKEFRPANYSRHKCKIKTL